jgi:hypothetical protein
MLESWNAELHPQQAIRLYPIKIFRNSCGREPLMWDMTY